MLSALPPKTENFILEISPIKEKMNLLMILNAGFQVVFQSIYIYIAHNRFSVKYLCVFCLIIPCGYTERHKNDLEKQSLLYSYFSAKCDKRCHEGHVEKTEWWLGIKRLCGVCERVDYRGI